MQLTGYKTANAHYGELGKTSLQMCPFYMGTGLLVPHSLNISSTPYLAYFWITHCK